MDYEEEENGLFGSDVEDVNPAAPITSASRTISSPARPSLTTPIPLSRAIPASTSRPPTPFAGPSRPGQTAAMDRRYAQDDINTRLEVLRERKGEDLVREYHVRGVRSLRSCCMDVIRECSARIWDVGDMEYPMIKPFLDNLPRDQLAEIELASPHVKEDTDWLWEFFILEEYPLFHERCAITKEGVPRTKGWRRMYRKARQDSEDRQAAAKNRLAERYKQLEKDREAKSIVVMDRLVPDKKKRPFTARGSIGSSGASKAGGSGAIAKARAETQRARVAMTHASGKFTLPPDRARGSKARNESSLFANPYIQSQAPQPHPQYLARGPSRPISNGPRLPAPRVRLPVHPVVPTQAEAQSPPPRIRGSYPTSEEHTRRTALPAHLEGQTRRSPEKEERFSIPETRPKAFQTVHKPDIANFEPPTAKAKGVMVDFFGDGNGGGAPSNAPSGFLESLRRSQIPQADSPADRGARGAVAGQKRPAPAAAKDKEVESVLFRSKKKRPVPGVKGR